MEFNPLFNQYLYELWYGLDDQEIGLRFLVETRDFSPLQSVQPAAGRTLPPI